MTAGNPESAELPTLHICPTCAKGGPGTGLEWERSGAGGAWPEGPDYIYVTYMYE